MKINTGKGTMPLLPLLAIWSVSAIVSLPGLAISPIMGELNTIFDHVSKLEIEMLESLPSLMIIPFMLLAGRWSVTMNKRRLLMLGTTIFLLSGVGCMLTRNLTALIIIGGVMGIGAGMVIPLSTGLVVDYFTGDQRVRQLGISSAINNLTLVVATLVVGYLADKEWHLAFLVYLLPVVTLLLTPALRRTPAVPEPKEGAQNRQQSINREMLLGLMIFYFLITYLSLIVTFNTSFLVERNGLGSSLSGTIISLFFLAIMAPGFVLNTIIRWLGRSVNVWSLVVMGAGLVVMSMAHHTTLTLAVGAVLTGLGYGVMQPIIYDKAATNSPPRLATFALSLIMAVNYFAILVAPFILDGINRFFHTTSPTFGFLVNGVVTLFVALLAALSKDSNRVLGSDD